MTSRPDMSPDTLNKAPVYRLTDRKDGPAKTLDRLLRENHASHAVLREPRLLFHNHIPHVRLGILDMTGLTDLWRANARNSIQALGSSYVMGASSSKLEEIYAADSPNLTSVDGGVLRNAISRQNWRKYLGQKQWVHAICSIFCLTTRIFKRISADTPPHMSTTLTLK